MRSVYGDKFSSERRHSCEILISCGQKATNTIFIRTQTRKTWLQVQVSHGNQSNFYSMLIAVAPKYCLNFPYFDYFADSWVKFFQAAGVPSSAAATYAHIFHENRMDFDMLTDLNKEYLREMGITPMGDIISILRYCTKCHALYLLCLRK